MTDAALRPGVNLPDEMERDALVRRIRRIERRVQEDLNVIAAWNFAHPNEAPLVYDDDGRVERSVAGLGLDYSVMLERAVAKARSGWRPSNALMSRFLASPSLQTSPTEPHE